MTRIFLIIVTCMITLISSGREIEIASGNISEAMFSPDGKYISLVIKKEREYSLFIINVDEQESIGTNNNTALPAYFL